MIRRFATGVRSTLRVPALVGGATLALAACDPVDLATAPSAPTVDTTRAVQVALLVPHGSSDRGRQALARNLENAARLAVRDLSGVEIDLRVYGTAGDPGRAVAEANRAVADGASIILGPVFSPVAQAVAQAVAPQNVNVLSFSNNSEIAGGNLFVLGQTFENSARRLLQYAAAQERGSTMLVTERNTAGEVATRAVQRAAGRSGTSLAAVETYEFSQQGIVDALPRLAATARSSGAQSILFSADTAGALPLLTQLLPENGITPDQFQFMGLTRWDIPQAALQLPGVQGGWFALPDPTLTRQFEARYQSAYGESPHVLASLGYDGIAAIGALLRQGRSDALSRNALTQAQGFAGANGVFRFGADGSAQRGVAVATIRDNQVVVISPAPSSFAGAGS